MARLRSQGVLRGPLAESQRSLTRAVIEGFLHRCAFDDTVSLEQMEATEPLAAYLAACRATDGCYEFRHEAHLITWEQRA